MMDRHAKFLKMTLNMLPSSAAGYDMQRMTILYFAVSGIVLLRDWAPFTARDIFYGGS